jgi:hypothetical protein
VKTKLANDLSDLQFCYAQLRKFFEGDEDKVEAWFTIKNPNFGYTSAKELFKRGRGHKVRQFIEAQLED